MNAGPKRVPAVVLAGGASSRMGRDKALLTLPDGRTALQAVLEAARAVASPVFLAVDTPAHAERLLVASQGPAPRLLLDETPGAGPLAAMAAAMAAVKAAAILALAVDTPLLRPALLDLLARALSEGAGAGIEIATPVVGGIPQPLPAAYATTLADRAAALVRAGRGDLRALREGVGVRYLDEITLRSVDPDLRSFLSANTPEEWAALLAHIAGPSA